MELLELIAKTKSEYVGLAVRLMTDQPYRAHVRQELERRRAALFNDQSVMGPLQDFLMATARPL
jgi:predicted O-linked N-acetylglucosamine transferase (SPINDLY family)